MKNKTMAVAVAAVLLVFGFALATPALAERGSGSEGTGMESDSNSGSNSGPGSGRNSGESHSGSGSGVSGDGVSGSISASRGDNDGESRTRIRIESRGDMSTEEPDEAEELPDFEVRAFIVGNVTQVKIEVKFMPESNDTDAVLEEAFELVKTLTEDDISSLLRIREKDVDLRNDAELEIGAALAELELRFTVNATTPDGIVDAVTEKLADLTLQDLEEMTEIERVNEVEEVNEIERTRIDIDARNGNTRIRIRARGENAEAVLESLMDLLASIIAAIEGMM